jgi:hypothetical protein
MGQIPPDKSLDEIDREAIAIWKIRRKSGLPRTRLIESISSLRISSGVWPKATGRPGTPR